SHGVGIFANQLEIEHRGSGARSNTAPGFPGMKGAMRSVYALVSVLLFGCGGGSAEPAKAPESDGAAPAAAAPEAGGSEAGAEKPAEGAAAASGVPTKCHKAGAVCSPDPQFVKRLCNGKFPSIGLYLFSNPAWTRGYLTRRTQAWNASGGASDS